jgi:NTE family protein
MELKGIFHAYGFVVEKAGAVVMRVQRRRIGIALCGAELTGSAHIGILFALENIGIKPQMVAGTSAGALIASMYAHGYSFDEFREAVRNFPGLWLFDYGFPLVSSTFNLVRHSWLGSTVPIPNGVFRGEKLQRYVKRLHQNRLPKIPLYVVATDLNTTNPVTFTNDDIAVKRGYAETSTDLPREIVGSCTIPGLLTPVRHRKWTLVDGGVRHLVPVSILQQVGCDKIFAVDVMTLPQDWYPVTIADILKRSLDVLLDEAVESSDLLGDSIFVINPELNQTSWWSSQKTMVRSLELGYQYVMDRKDDILRFLSTEKL